MYKAKKLLILADYFDPAKFAGGPIKTIKNLIKELENDFDITLLTRGNDLGKKKYFDSVIFNHESIYSNIKVYYLKRDIHSLKLILKHVLDKGSIVYLNSFFSFKFSIFPLLICSFFFRKKSIVISPRGELNIGALKNNWFQKKLYLTFSRLTCIYNNCDFLVTSIEEHARLRNILNVSEKSITIAGNLINKPVFSPKMIVPNSSTKSIRIVTLCRIAPIKNLEFSLSVLRTIKEVVQFDIYGNIEDREYYSKLVLTIRTLPSNIVVNFCGFVDSDQVHNILSNYDLFLFPTLGENFGHVIIESIQSGTPVLLSPFTPFQEVHEPVVNVFPLDIQLWSRNILRLANIILEERILVKNKCIKYSSIFDMNQKQNIYIIDDLFSKKHLSINK